MRMDSVRIIHCDLPVGCFPENKWVEKIGKKVERKQQSNCDHVLKLILLRFRDTSKFSRISINFFHMLALC